MTKDNIKLIASDIDGTLIDDNDELPENFDAVINELNKRGIMFVAASGRGISSIKSKIQNDSENVFIVSDNGAVLQHKGKTFFQNNFSNDEVKEIVSVFRKYSEASIIATNPEMSYCELHPDHNEDFLKEFFVDYKIVDDITKCNSDFVKITVRSDNHTSENLKLSESIALSKKHHLVRAGIPWTDIMKADSNKGNALEVLLDYLKIKPEETIGFGDYHNDIHMLEVVGKSYSMQEAHKDVKAMTDETIGSNNDNAVLKKIIELLELDI